MRRWSMSVTSLPSTDSNMALSGKVVGFKPLWVWAFYGEPLFVGGEIGFKFGQKK